MQTSRAAIASAAFFVVAPGTVVGLIPWLITRWEIADSTPMWRIGVGVVLIVAGLIPPVHAFAQFVKAGGTPMPIAPTQRLVVTGFNRYVRNPMYVGLIVAILGQALLFGSMGLVVYAAVAWIITASFVRWYEEPTLVREYGSEYEAYRRNVHAWLTALAAVDTRGRAPAPDVAVMSNRSRSSYRHDSDCAYPSENYCVLDRHCRPRNRVLGRRGGGHGADVAVPRHRYTSGLSRLLHVDSRRLVCIGGYRAARSATPPAQGVGICRFGLQLHRCCGVTHMGR